METTPGFARRGWILSGLLMIALVGCGDGRPKRVAVSGQVLIDGQPLTCGDTRLIPNGMRPATGKIGPDGRFVLGTYNREDGCVPGSHKVIVVALEILDGSFHKWHAPKKYARPTTSGLTAEIIGPTDSLTIELTWDGQPGPLVERFVGEDE